MIKAVSRGAKPAHSLGLALQPSGKACVTCSHVCESFLLCLRNQRKLSIFYDQEF